MSVLKRFLLTFGSVSLHHKLIIIIIVMKTNSFFIGMKRLFVLLALPILAVCFGSCSKDDKVKVVSDIDVLCGTWFFDKELSPENLGVTGESAIDDYIHSKTRYEEKQDMIYQRIEILSNGRFVWEKRYDYHNVWLGDKMGDKEVVQETKGRIEREDNKLSFLYDEWFEGNPGLSFTFAISADGNILALERMENYPMAEPYILHFWKNKP
jgi:hypothetical protein